MSYRGRPSKGCELCRARKVKCDETKPACSRCSKSNYDCKYRDQDDLLFRNQTASAAQRAEESWRKRSKSNQQRALSESSASNSTPPSNKSSPPSLGHQPLTNGGQHSRQSSPGGLADEPSHRVSNGTGPIVDIGDLTIAPQVKADIHRLAYERFIYDFISSASPDRSPYEPSDAIWTFIPILYQNTTKDSVLTAVVDAVAYVNFANRCNAPQAATLAEECLGKGITILSRAIADKTLAKSNDALCSVYLMSVYENLTVQQRKGTFIAHIHGASALLGLRSVEQYYSNPISAGLYEVAYAQMLLGSLQAGKYPPLPMRNIANVKGYLPNLYSNANAIATGLIWRETVLHAKWHEYKRSSSIPTRRTDLHELLQSVLCLSGEFQAWEATIPPGWRYQVEPNTPEIRSTYDEKWQKLILGSRGAPEEIHLYSTLKRCWIWSFYRTSRMLLLRDLLEIINWMFKLPEPESHAHADSESSTVPREPSPTNLDNTALCMHQSSVTAELVNMIETSCSGIIGSFTVPILSKSHEDVVGMRGYICLWTLGTMDAVLAAGLVPDSMAFNDPPSAGHGSPQTSPFPQATNLPPQALAMHSKAPLSIQTEIQKPYAIAPQFSKLSTLLPPPHSTSPPIPHSPSHPTPTTEPAASNPIMKKGHIFDSSPAHLYDFPVNLPALDGGTTQPKKLDVAARREWLNGLLYYIGSELGIEKALYVPLTEGFMQTVKPNVDSILGR